jgi:ribonucleotide monophosphatase NagD (HAD superfamily)
MASISENPQPAQSSKFRGVLFDIDGTLFHSDPGVFEA